MYSAVKHFSFFLEGQRFHIYTDHKPLTFALASSSNHWTPRQQRHLALVAEYTTDIWHIHGRNNTVADALSRVELGGGQACMSAGLPDIDIFGMAQTQKSDPAVQAYRTAITRLVLADIPISDSNATILCDLSTGTPRPIVPPTWWRKVFDVIHGLAHPGVRATRKMVAERFVWHGMNKQVGMWAKTCLSCQKAKVHRHVSAPLEHGHLPDRHLKKIHVDIVGPLPVSRGYTYLFTIIDRYTRWPEAIPMSDDTADSCARALLSHHIAQFGVPSDITSDRGPQFTSALWTSLSRLLGAQLHRTTAYHPQSNGIVERFHRQLKAALRARLIGPDWANDLPLVLLGLWSAPKVDLKCAPTELVFGTTLRLPGEFFDAATSSVDPVVSDFFVRLRTTIASVRPQETSHHRQHTAHLPATLQTCAFVFVRHDAHRTPLQCTYDGPFRVLARATKFCTLDINGRRDTVSVDRLKPAFLDKDFGLEDNAALDPVRPSLPVSSPLSAHQSAPSAPDPPPTTAGCKDASDVRPALRIVGKSRRGRTIRLPARLNAVTSVTGGGGGEPAQLTDYTMNYYVYMHSVMLQTLYQSMIKKFC